MDITDVLLALLKCKTFGSYLNVAFINCSEHFMEFFNKKKSVNY